jgi:hypothetical protein
MENRPVISAAVEGIVDEAVVRRLIAHAGAEPGDVHGKNGKSYLRRKINGYNSSAQRALWFVLVDLDHDADCAPPLCSDWLPDKAPGLCFRVAVRAVEAWLLADAERLAKFLGVARSKIPADPQALDNPKAVMIDLARGSRRRDIREDMVPRPGSGRRVGPAYSSRLIEFASKHWRPDIAGGHADSLKRAIRCIKQITAARL